MRSDSPLRRGVYLAVMAAAFAAALSPARAHSGNQAPYFKIDGSYSNFYAAPLSSLADLDIPQDGPPGTYFVGKQIEFEVDVDKVGIPADVSRAASYRWDFGDGGTGSGLKNTHTYRKMGSYIIHIDVQYDKQSDFVGFESVLVNILPDSSYKLPQAIIKVNGASSPNPSKDVLYVDASKGLNFSAAASAGGSAPIVSYQWDLGDQSESSEHSFKHQYASKSIFTAVILRVKDNNGFISDQGVTVADNSFRPVGSASEAPKKSYLPLVAPGVAVAVVLAGLAVMIIKRRTKTRLK